MPRFTPAVIDFVFGFVVDDIQKVLKCSPDDARDVLHKVVIKHLEKKTLNTGKHYQDTKTVYHKNRYPVLDREEPPPKTFVRAKGVYSNQNPLDKYQ